MKVNLIWNGKAAATAVPGHGRALKGRRVRVNEALAEKLLALNKGWKREDGPEEAGASSEAAQSSKKTSGRGRARRKEDK